MYICVRIMRDLSTQIVFWFIYWKDLVHLQAEFEWYEKYK